MHNTRFDTIGRLLVTGVAGAAKTVLTWAQDDAQQENWNNLLDALSTRSDFGTPCSGRQPDGGARYATK